MKTVTRSKAYKIFIALSIFLMKIKLRKVMHNVLKSYLSNDIMSKN
jgi:hypothetical protein